MTIKKSCCFFLSLGLSLLLAACGGSSKPIAVTITASATTVDAGNSITLTVSVANDAANSGVNWSVTGGGTLTNTTPTSATYNAPAPSATAVTATVTATSIKDSTKTTTITINVPAAPSISTGGLASATVGTAYSATLAASGGIPPYTWALTSGTLPVGMTMTAAGTISGTPMASAVGTSNLTFKVTDSGTPNPLTATVNLSITINAAPAITFPSTTLADATFNAAYSATVAATGGAGTLTYSITAGALPAGVTLSAAGAITGTPTVVGTFPITVKAADAFGDSATQAFTLQVKYPALVITPATLPTGYVGSAYASTTLAATGGSGTGFTWSLANSTTLPAGLNMSSAGVITGNPTTTGTTNFTVKVTDSASNTGTLAMAITVKPAVSITTSSPLPTGYVGSAYSQTLSATGGSGSGYTWTVSGGTSAPAGLSLSSAGVLSGTPTTAGSPTFKVTVTDSASNTATATFAMTISPGVSITTASLPDGYQSGVYAPVTLAATGGNSGPYTWTWAAAGGSSIPAGMQLSTAGVLSGTPTVSGTFNVVITAKDGVNNTASVTFTLKIEAVLSITTGATLPSGTKNVAYSQALQASGGSGTGYTWSTTGANTLATLNLSFNTANGTITGTPATTGTAGFTAVLTDSQSHTAQTTFSVTVYNALTITTTTLPAGSAGTAYSQTLNAGGGTGTGYTWAATASNLSTYGLALSSAGVISGTPTQSGTATFTANVTDSASSTATQALSITIYGALTLPTNSFAGATTGVAYTGSVSASGGSGNYTLIQTGLPSDGLGASIVGATLTVSGTPTAASTVNFNVTVTDTVTNQSVGPKAYSITVTDPTPLALPTPNPSTLPSATVNTAYNGTIVATGGVSPYTWTVNTVAVPTNQTPLALSNGLSVTNDGTATLKVTGTPSSTGSAAIAASIKDALSHSAGPNNYAVTINSAGSQVSGKISLTNNNCAGGGGSQPIFTVTINTPTPQSVQTDNQGNYAFASVPNGTYTITPSISTASSSLFVPASYTGVVVNNAAVNGKDFGAGIGYTVSGHVTYNNGGTAQTGQTFVLLKNNNCGGNSGPGTSITNTQLTSGGAFTIRGVVPGNYTATVWMDAMNEGVPNANDPNGSASFAVNGNVTGQTITMSNPSFATPSGNPKIQILFPTSGGVLLPYQDSRNTNNVEDANQYTVQWSTSPTLASGAGSAFATVSGSHTFKAIGNKTNVWIMTNALLGANTFTDGTTYYFQARSINTLATTQSPAGWSTYTGSGSAPVGVVVGAPTCSGTCTLVSGTITIPTGTTIAAGAPLYASIYQQSTGGKGPKALFAQAIASPAVGANNYSITVPSGSGYFLFGILDQNKDGLIDVGDLANPDQGNSPGVTVSGSSQTVNSTLPNVNGIANVSTQYESINYQGGSNTSYNLNLNVREQNKLPVAATLTSGPNMVVPVDMGLCTDCGSPQFQYNASPVGGTPAVGDQYNFTVTYSDGTQDTGSTINGKVTAFGNTGAVVGPSDLITNLAPTGNSSTSTTPTFTWTFPANPGDYEYNLSIYSTACSSNCGNIWQIPNSNASGFTYAQTGSGTTGTLVWGVDPIPGDNSPAPTGPLSLGTVYNWQIQAQDANGNQAQTSTWYQP